MKKDKQKIQKLEYQKSEGEISSREEERARSRDKKRKKSKLSENEILSHEKKTISHHKNKEKESKQWNKQKQKNEPVKRKVNSNILSNMILQQKRTNKRLDQEQVERAAEQFKMNFNQSIKPINMSAYLSDQSLKNKQKIQGFIGIILKCPVQECQQTFNEVIQLQKHIQKHKKQILKV